MTIQVVTRAEWQEGWNSPYRFESMSTPLFPSWDKIQWLVVHWPGGNVRPNNYTEMVNLIRNQQVQYRRKTDPYNLGYNWLLDPWGKFWQARGFTYRNAANDGDKLKATMGNINYITMSVQIVCNLNEGANDAQVRAMRDMHKEVEGFTKRRLLWRPHWYSDSTVCPGPINSALIEADQFNSVVAPPVVPPPSGYNPPVGERKEQTIMLDYNGMKMEYDGFKIRRIKSGNAVFGEAIPVTDTNVFDILNEEGVRVVGTNPFDGSDPDPNLVPYRHDYLAAAWRNKVQQGLTA